MARINENYLKLAGAYLFPEIARRVTAFCDKNPRISDRLIRCGIGDVTEPLPDAVREAMHQAVDEMGKRETFRGYGEPTGYAFLREAIAKGDFQDHGLNIDAEEIFISDGSKTDCSAILDILASGEKSGGGNRIGITNPVYPVYVDSNVMAGNTGSACEDGGYEGIVYLPCTPGNGFVPEPPESSVEKLDLIYLCYPNNPTGGMINHDKLGAWVEYALSNNALIFYDVAYQSYIRDTGLPRSIYEIEDADRCAIEFHSFSKNGGFTGVRCGYTALPRKLLGYAADGSEVKLHDLWKRRWSTKSNCVGYIVQRAAEAIYSPSGKTQVQELVRFYLENARILREGCESKGLTVYGGVNAPYVWVTCPEGVSSWAMFDRMLEEANVVITPGVGFGSEGEGFFRISAFNSRENVEEVVSRLTDLNRLRPKQALDDPIWFRPMRTLLEDGKPLRNRVSMLAFHDSDTSHICLFGALTETMQGRICFWPCLTDAVTIVDPSGKKIDLDHLTLDPNEKTHITSSDGEHHRSTGRRLVPIPSQPIDHWFTLLVKLERLHFGESFSECKIKIPTSDKNRRMKEIDTYVKNLVISYATLPELVRERDYVACCFYLISDQSVSITPDESLISGVGVLSNIVDNYDEGGAIRYRTSEVTVGDSKILIVVTMPSGILRTDVAIGMPRSN